MTPPLRRLVLLGPPGVGKGTYGTALAHLLRVPLVSSGHLLRQMVSSPPSPPPSGGASASTSPAAASSSALGDLRKAMGDGGLAAGASIVDLVADELRAQRAMPPATAGAVTTTTTTSTSPTSAPTGYILDGVPRTVEQAERMARGGDQGAALIPVDGVVVMTLAYEAMLEKVLGRRLCRDCPRQFNMAWVKTNELDLPPMLPGETPPSCATCHDRPRLYRREDDTAEVFAKRMAVYEAETRPVIDFYRDYFAEQRAAGVQGLGGVLEFNITGGVQQMMPVLSGLVGHVPTEA